MSSDSGTRRKVARSTKRGKVRPMGIKTKPPKDSQKKKKPIQIVIERQPENGGGGMFAFRAYLKNNPNRGHQYGSGRSVDEALGSLVSYQGRQMGLEIEKR